MYRLRTRLWFQSPCPSTEVWHPSPRPNPYPHPHLRASYSDHTLPADPCFLFLPLPASPLRPSLLPVTKLGYLLPLLYAASRMPPRLPGKAIRDPVSTALSNTTHGIEQALHRLPAMVFGVLPLPINWHLDRRGGKEYGPGMGQTVPTLQGERDGLQ
ncbi:hypothetical protein B0H11DRAFT_2204249 [Mycena galericulata]|nr:hypothetical protein B0H11DRAFT_2204249 [Mycena galericulata]